MTHAKHTDHPQTFEVNDYSGENWLIAVVDFGRVIREDGSKEDVTAFITTDHVHASELEYGEPEADLRLWTHARELLKLAYTVIGEPGEFDDAADWNAERARGRLCKMAQAIIDEVEGGE